MKLRLFYLIVFIAIPNLVYTSISSQDSIKLHSIDLLANDILLSDIDSARDVYESGIALAKKINSSQWLATFNEGLGHCDLYQGKYLKATNKLLESIELYTEVGDSLGLHSALFSLALVDFYTNNSNQSEKLYKRCIEYFNSVGDTLKEAQSYNNLGLIAHKQDSLEKALAFFKQSKVLKSNLNMRESSSITRNNIADIYLKTGKFDSAKVMFETNLKEGEELGSRTITAVSYIGLASVEIKTQITPNTLSYLDKAADISKVLKNDEMLRNVYEETSNFYVKKGNYKDAYYYYQQFHSLSDSLLNKEKQTSIQELKVRYESEKKNQAIAQLQKNKKLHLKMIRQQKMLNTSIGLFLFITIVILVLYIRLFRNQKSLNGELQQKNFKINAQNAELKKLNTTKNRLFSIIAHDIKNPFTSIMGFSELLVTRFDKLKPAKVNYYTQNIHSSSKKIFELLEDLLTWARSQLDKLEPAYEKIALHEIFNEVNMLIDASLTQKNNNFLNEVNEDLVVYSDRNMLTTIVRNIITNANKYTKDGFLQVGAAVVGRMVEINIIDNGIGMDDNQLNQLFNFESITSKDGTNGEKGTGLGMHLCLELTKILNGEIMAESKPNKGTSVTIKLPVKSDVN
ncbi:MAG: tetratricopeptide repeat-containing sensor histidine kinase [Bacteroidales bacterium]|nr:tetratricopeptide repeat-containing sensor histidine kinase [Bacteroidales bacterium]